MEWFQYYGLICNKNSNPFENCILTSATYCVSKEGLKLFTGSNIDIIQGVEIHNLEYY